MQLFYQTREIHGSVNILRQIMMYLAYLYICHQLSSFKKFTKNILHYQYILCIFY